MIGATILLDTQLLERIERLFSRWKMDGGWEDNTRIFQCILLQWWWPITSGELHWFQQSNQDARVASSCPHREQDLPVASVAAGANVSACCSRCERSFLQGRGA